MSLFGSLFHQSGASGPSANGPKAYNPHPSHGLMDNPFVRVADALFTGGVGAQFARNSDKRAQNERQRVLMGSLPLPSGYAPPSHASPQGPDGKPLTDPLAEVPDQVRMQAWMRDFAAAGGNVPLSAMMPPQSAAQTMEGTDGIYEKPAGGKWARAIEYPPKVDPNADLRRMMLEQQMATNAALEKQRLAMEKYYGVKADHPYAPQRPRAARAGALNANSVKWD